MSSSEGGTESVPVTVNAEKDTEIFVIDAAFNLKARGVEQLNEELDPGLYKLKFRTGDLVQEVHAVVEPGGGPVEFTSPPSHFASPAPLSETGTTDGRQEEAAAHLSREVHRHLGSGSQIFLFTRCYTGHVADPAALKVDNPARGLSLHDPQGRLLVDFERESKPGSGSDPAAGCTVELEPGSYRLRVRTQQWGALEQAVVASPGWQTQIFLWHTDDEGARVPDLAGACVLLVELGAGFDPDSHQLRSSELARVALAEGRVFMPRHQLEEMVSYEVVDPMAAIYACHALVGAGEADPDLLAAVIDRLRGLVGAHPDVEALDFFLQGSAGTGHRYEMPPMLASSWSLVVSASARQPELVPPGSLAARVSTALWGDGPWLIWLADGLEQHAGKIHGSLDAAVSRIADLAGATKTDEVGVHDPGAELDDAEEALLSVVLPLARPASASRRLSLPTGPATEVPHALPAPPTLEANVADRLGVPPAAVEGLTASLLTKLGDQARTADTGQELNG